MRQSPFLKHLPLFVKMFTFLDLKTKRFNNYLLFIKISLMAFFFLSTISCLCVSEQNQQDYFLKSIDLLLFCIFFSNEIFLIKYKSQVCTLVVFLMEPLDEFEPNTVRSQIVEDYYGGINLYGKLATRFFSMGLFLWTGIPLLLSVYSESVGDSECVDLALGWVWKSKYYWGMLPVYVASAVVAAVTATSFLLWYLIMAYVVTRISLNIKLLCADLDDLNSSVDWSVESFESGSSRVMSMYWEEERLMRTAPRANGPPSRLQRMENEIGVLESILRKYCGEKVMRDRVKAYFANIVEQHVNIIKYVKLADKTFRHSIMVYVQLGVITVALCIPKMSLNAELVMVDYIQRGVEVCSTMTHLGIINYLGQILLDESESLRQALYSCDWTDKPLGFRKGLLTMQIMANKPLKLTVGGIYSLSMENYANIVRATYSYTSLLQSLSPGEH